MPSMSAQSSSRSGGSPLAAESVARSQRRASTTASDAASPSGGRSCGRHSRCSAADADAGATYSSLSRAYATPR